MKTQNKPIGPYEEWKLMMATAAQSYDKFVSDEEPMEPCFQVEAIEYAPTGYAFVTRPMTLQQAFAEFDDLGVSDSAKAPRLHIVLPK